MLLIAGTIPVKDMSLTFGQVKADGDHLIVNDQHLLCTQGTGAMISAALATTSHLGLEAPHALVAGDIGQGNGSRAIYNYLSDNIVQIAPKVLALHYWLPNMTQSKQLCDAIKKCEDKPIMIADAASMYSAKAAGLAQQFDIFTPDATEIAFLADPLATHPAYVQKHLFDTDITQTPNLVASAYKNKSAAKLLLVKGSIDYIAKDGQIVETIEEPDIPALEAIGGTGDTITGLVSAFVYSGFDPREAAVLATKVNRTAGKAAQVTPATRVSRLIGAFAEVMNENLREWSGVRIS